MTFLKRIKVFLIATGLYLLGFAFVGIAYLHFYTGMTLLVIYLVIYLVYYFILYYKFTKDWYLIMAEIALLILIPMGWIVPATTLDDYKKLKHSIAVTATNYDQVFASRAATHYQLYSFDALYEFTGVNDIVTTEDGVNYTDRYCAIPLIESTTDQSLVLTTPVKIWMLTEGLSCNQKQNKIPTTFEVEAVYVALEKKPDKEFFPAIANSIEKFQLQADKGALLLVPYTGLTDFPAIRRQKIKEVRSFAKISFIIFAILSIIPVFLATKRTSAFGDE